MLSLVVLFYCGLLLALFWKNVSGDPARYFHLPIHDLMQNSVYLKLTDFQEIVVANSEKGSDLRQDDYITHADGIRILNGGLSNFLKSGEKEAVVPVIDDTDFKHNGHKLIGFVMISAVTPRKLTTRRGEIVYDMEEGGAAPTMKLGNIVMGPGGVKTTNDQDYQRPQHGGGACISGRDCFNFNGTCISGQCSCHGPYTGSYCQLNRPDFVAASILSKKIQSKTQPQHKDAVETKDILGEKVQNNNDRSGDRKFQQPDNVLNNNDHSGDRKFQQPDNENAGDSAIFDLDNAQKGKKEGKKRKRAKITSDSQSQVPPPTEPAVETSRQLTVEDLYGENRPYPEPAVAGRLPHQVLRDRQLKRMKRETFLYSVRFRTGPLGIIFDNKISNGTRVEKLVRGQQAEVSDIKEGDRLLAVETFNMTLAPAKASQRILNDLPWPKTLVFEATASGDDPSLQEQKIKTRTLNISVVYPPTLFGEYTFRLGEWAPFLDLKDKDTCPIFRLKAPEDSFGCNIPPLSYTFSDSLKLLITSKGMSAEKQAESMFLSLVLQQSIRKKVDVKPTTAAIMKRGICTFVEKGKTLANGGAELGLIVNSDDELIDMPAGREKTSECTVPVGIMKSSEGQYLHLAARTNEVWAILTEDSQGSLFAPSCTQVLNIVEDLIDKWPNSVPPLAAESILNNKPPDPSKIRGLTEEGGRLALSGENGWAFFDYHLAMFGPQEVPLGPMRLVMAIPPFGCDPNAYTVRISDAVVAILRGGGCSLGIKVINAQKLGAKAVMIVNTDDMKTMRISALPDEVPLIKIPTIMVSRRIQYYLEEQLRPYSPVNQHLISIQPTGVFGDYELKNTLQLPTRLQI